MYPDPCPAREAVRDSGKPPVERRVRQTRADPLRRGDERGVPARADRAVGPVERLRPGDRTSAAAQQVCPERAPISADGAGRQNRLHEVPARVVARLSSVGRGCVGERRGRQVTVARPEQLGIAGQGQRDGPKRRDTECGGEGDALHAHRMHGTLDR